MPAAPRPGGDGGGGVSKPAVFTTTVTGSVQDKAFGTGLSGVRVSALTVPVNPENKPAVSDADGSFTLQVKHSGRFKLVSESTACCEGVTTADISASADGSYDAGAIGLTAKPEPTGAARCTFTPKDPAADKKFKLTVNCVREIIPSEFSAFGGIISGTIIMTKARDEGLTTDAQARSMITEISLPPTLTAIGNDAFSYHKGVSGILNVPRNVETVGNGAFMFLGGAAVTSAAGGVSVKFENGSRLKNLGDTAFQLSVLRDFVLPENVESIGQSTFGNAGFRYSSTGPKIFTIPAKVSKIGNDAFGAIISHTSGITDFEIRSDALAKPVGGSAPFPLGNDLFSNVSGIAKVTLPQAVYDSYSKAELQAIFGSGFSNYRRPDGRAYDFAAKL